MANDLLLKNLDADGHEILSIGTPTQAGSATTTDNTTAPSDVGATAAPGASLLAAPADHTHEGVHGIGVDGGAPVSGDVNLISGPGVNVSRVGNDITIKAAAGSTNKVTLSHEGAGYSVGTSEQILREWVANFDDTPAATIQLMIAAIVKANAGIGTFKVYVGATNPDSTVGATVRATFTTTSVTEEKKFNLGATFANPTGRQIVQLVCFNDTAGAKTYARGIQISAG